MELENILGELSTEMKDLVASAITGNDGLTIAVYSNDSYLDINAISAEFASIVSAVSRAGEDLNAGKFINSVFTTENYQILTSQISDLPFFQIVCLKSGGNIGKARFLMGKFESKIKDALL